MNQDDEKRIVAHLAEAMVCFRNTMLVDIYAGLTLATRAGNDSGGGR